MNLITPSLLNSWLYYMDSPVEYEETARQSFLDALNKVKYPQTEAQLAGIKFEEHVRGIRDWGEDEDPYYVEAVLEARDIVKNGVWGMSCKRQIDVDGESYLLYGRPDVVRGPTGFDIKLTGHYSYGKYSRNTQHSCYMYCLDALWDFQYVVFDGLRIHIEHYVRDDCIDVVSLITDFSGWLKSQRIYATYREKWRAKG